MDEREKKKIILHTPLPVLPYLDKPIKKGEDIEIKRVNDLPLRGYSVVVYAQKRQISSSRKNVYLEAFRQEGQAVLDIVLERIKYCKGNQPQDRVGLYEDYVLWRENLTKWVEESMSSNNINVTNVDDLSEFFKLCDSQETLHKRYELMSSITWDKRKEEIHYNIKKYLELIRKDQKPEEIAPEESEASTQPTEPKEQAERKKPTEKIVAVTLTEFMEKYCEGPLSKSILHSRKESLFKASGRDIQLPKHIGEWRLGKKKYFDPIELKANWPNYRKFNPNLPSLKQSH